MSPMGAFWRSRGLSTSAGFEMRRAAVPWRHRRALPASRSLAQRDFKALTARDRVMIAKLEGEEAHSHGVARRVGKHTSTISGELRRNAATVTPNDRLLDFGVKRLWSEEQLDEYVSTLPSEEQRTHHVWGGFRLPKRYRKRKRRRRPQVTSCGAGLREVEEHGRRASLELALRELGGPRALTVDNGKELYGSRVSVAFDR